MALKFFNTEKPKVVDTRVPERIQRLKTEEIVSWMDSTIMVLGQSFDNWRHHDGDIGEVALVTETLDQMARELAERFSK